MAQLDHLIVCSGGQWARGQDRKATLTEFRKHHGGAPKKGAVWYRCSGNTRIDNDGMLRFPKEDPHPELIE